MKNNKSFLSIFADIWLFVALMMLMANLLSAMVPKEEPLNVTYNEFVQMIENGEIQTVEYSEESDYLQVTTKDEKEFEILNPGYETFRHELMLKDVEVKIKNTVHLSDIIGTVLSFVSMIIMMSLVVFLLTKNAPKTKTHVMIQPVQDDKKNDSHPKKTFQDVAGLKEVKQDLEGIVDILKNREKYEKAGAKLPKGVLLYGPPGTGKTLLAKAIAGEANVGFLFVSASDFDEMYVGVGASRIRSLFREARKNAPCIIFIDEIDALGKKREEKSHSEKENTLNALLTEMDGFVETENVLIIGATNRFETLDDALLRPGRFTNKYCVPLPNGPEERLEILNLYKKGKNFDETVDFASLSKELTGFSPAQIESLLNEATILSVQDDSAYISKKHVDKAIVKMIVEGHVREDQTGRSKEELEVVAWHEAGHALVGRLKGKSVPKVTILSTTSGAGGFTLSHSEKEHLLSKENLVSEAMELYGGRLGELVLFHGDEDKITTGASNDFERATNIVENIILKFGMTEKFGPVVMSKDEVAFKEAVFEEKVRLSKEIYKKAEDFIVKHREKLEAIAKELLEKETIYEADLDRIIG